MIKPNVSTRVITTSTGEKVTVIEQAEPSRRRRKRYTAHEMMPSYTQLREAEQAGWQAFCYEPGHGYTARENVEHLLDYTCLNAREEEAQRQANAAAALRARNVKRGEELDAREGELDERELSEIAPALSDAKRTVESADEHAREQRASADSYVSGRRAEADAEADEVVRRATRRWGGPLRFLGHMLGVAAQFCAQRALKDSGTTWAHRADVLRTASDVLDEIENHPRENVREAFSQFMERRLVEFDRKQRDRGVTTATVSYTYEAPRLDGRQFDL